MHSTTDYSHAEKLRLELEQPLFNPLLKKWVGRGELDYELYLKTPTLLSLQSTETELVAHDELMFQIVHQSQELWLKLVSREMVEVVDELDRDSLWAVSSRLERVARILRCVSAEMAVLETMTPDTYQTIRRSLGNGSGQESPGYNTLRTAASGMEDALDRLLARRSTTLMAVYSGHGTTDLKRVCEQLVDADEAFQGWLYAHFQLVRRTIGVDRQVKALDGLPSQVLAARMNLPLFRKLWDVRVEMTTAWKREGGHAPGVERSAGGGCPAMAELRAEAEAARAAAGATPVLADAARTEAAQVPVAAHAAGATQVPAAMHASPAPQVHADPAPPMPTAVANLPYSREEIARMAAAAGCPMHAELAKRGEDSAKANAMKAPHAEAHADATHGRDDAPRAAGAHAGHPEPSHRRPEAPRAGAPHLTHGTHAEPHRRDDTPRPALAHGAHAEPQRRDEAPRAGAAHVAHAEPHRRDEAPHIGAVHVAHAEPHRRDDTPRPTLAHGTHAEPHRREDTLRASLVHGAHAELRVGAVHGVHSEAVHHGGHASHAHVDSAHRRDELGRSAGGHPTSPHRAVDPITAGAHHASDSSTRASVGSPAPVPSTYLNPPRGRS
ncbi:hypothetical protein DRW03_10190 [Corallococcus sp. H22C18031201]|uniref:tryptophan 2,3-dioxygenase family protein n=1 Tax=Citreicoccus inhibens TaxID=2849499 RepID=UPI000E76C7E4|nr:tryptophan 2,3-dioxygenase family protein [Citreicoccus inhibens]RJS23977.1 hypothetical protein DRW03_10190 [Corallococcus sp. H22C18031201]